MLTRRRFVEYSALSSMLSSAMLAYRPLFWGQPAPAERPLRLAILGSVYRHQSQYANPRRPLSGGLSVRRRMAHA